MSQFLTVKKLKQQLQKFDQNMPVGISQHGGTIANYIQLQRLHIQLNWFQAPGDFDIALITNGDPSGYTGVKEQLPQLTQVELLQQQIDQLKQLNTLLRQHKIGPIGIKDKNNIQLEVNDVIVIKNSEHIPILDDGTGPWQPNNDICVIFYQKGVYKLKPIVNWITKYNGKTWEQLNGIIPDDTYTLTGHNIEFDLHTDYSDWGFDDVLDNFDTTDFELIAKYNPQLNIIQFVN